MQNLHGLEPCFCGGKECYIEERKEEVEDGEVSGEIFFYSVYCPSCAGSFEWSLDQQETIDLWNSFPRYKGGYDFIRGRLKVLRPRKRDFKEIKLLIGLTGCMNADDLKQQLVKIYHEILEAEQQKKIRAVKSIGYEVVAK